MSHGNPLGICDAHYIVARRQRCEVNFVGVLHSRSETSVEVIHLYALNVWCLYAQLPVCGVGVEPYGRVIHHAADANIVWRGIGAVGEWASGVGSVTYPLAAYIVGGEAEGAY